MCCRFSVRVLRSFISRAYFKGEDEVEDEDEGLVLDEVVGLE